MAQRRRDWLDATVDYLAAPKRATRSGIEVDYAPLDPGVDPASVMSVEPPAVSEAPPVTEAPVASEVPTEPMVAGGPFANTRAATAPVNQVRQAAGQAPLGEATTGEQTPANPAPVSSLELQEQSIRGKAEPVAEQLANQSIEARLRQDELNRELAARERARIEAQRATQAIAEEPIDPSRYADDMGTFGWVAAILGGMLGGAIGQPNQMAALIGKKIEDDIALQKQDRASRLAVARDRLGSAEAAEDAIRARYYNAVAQTAKAQAELGGFTAQTAGVLNTLAQDAELNARNAAAAAAAKANEAYQSAYGKEAGTQAAKRDFAPSGGGTPGAPIYQAAAEAGARAADVDAFRERKMSLNGQNYRVADVANAAEDMARNRDALVALANEGYRASSEGFVTLTERGREILRSLGMADMANQERIELESLMSGVVTRVAKSYGGVITDADREQARNEIGSSPRSAAAWLDRRAQTLAGELTREAEAVPVRGARGLAPVLPYMAPSVFAGGKLYED